MDCDIDSIIDQPASFPPPYFFLNFVPLGLGAISRWVQYIKSVCGLTRVPGWYTIMISFQILALF
jgi:hypothetical protein